MSNPGAPIANLPAPYAAMMGGGANLIQFLPNGAPIISNMQQAGIWSTTDWTNMEMVQQSLYDSAVYPAAGTQGLTFFQVPKGAGVGFGGQAKSLSDTNMDLNGMLSANTMQIVCSIEIEFQPTTPTVAAAMPAAFGAQAVAVQINDAYIFWRSGNFVLTILQKQYAQEAPLSRFPPSSGFSLQAAFADATTAAAAQQSRAGFGGAYGPMYILAPNNILIPPMTNFKASLTWPEGLQAITNPARVFVRLGGMLARPSQ